MPLKVNRRKHQAYTCCKVTTTASWSPLEKTPTQCPSPSERGEPVFRHLVGEREKKRWVQKNVGRREGGAPVTGVLGALNAKASHEPCASENRCRGKRYGECVPS